MFLPFALVAASLAAAAGSTVHQRGDVVVYGATGAGCVAAIAASRAGGSALYSCRRLVTWVAC